MPRRHTPGWRAELRRALGPVFVAWEAVALVGLLTGIPAAAAHPVTDSTRDTFGEVGMLDMPSAHMADDGQLAVTIGDVGSTQRYSLSFQFLPWLDGSFRYSRVSGTANGNGFYDRSLGFKVRLSREGIYAPDVSIGLRDILGTGVYSSEYVAASKHVGPLDFTAGLGWGRLADNGTLPNPFGLVFSSFKTRKSNTVATGGTVDFGQFFHGSRTGVFGGVVWQTPIDGVQILAEYSSDQYTAESVHSGGIKVRSPVNLGVSYRPYDTLGLSAGWFYGTTYGFTLSLNGDPTTAASPTRIGPQIPPPTVRDDIQQRQALMLMVDRNGRLAATRAGGVWVDVPTDAEGFKQNLMQALLSESRGVRDIDIQGGTLVVDALNQGNNRAQCAKYAQIASAAGATTTTVAMTDLQDADGTVVFCPVAGRATYAAAEAPSGSGPAKVAVEADLERTLRADFAAQALRFDALSLGTSELWLYYENNRYLQESEAAGRIVRLLMAAAPPSVEIFHLTPVRHGIPMQEITVSRNALERTTLAHGVASELGEAIALGAPPLNNSALEEAELYPRFRWSIGPGIRENFFDPDKPLQVQLIASANAEVEIARGWSLETGLTANIYNNYNFARVSNSVLPHVRSDAMLYFQKGEYGIYNLDGVYRTRLARDVFAEIKAGYLEDMYMGAGAQVLWRPNDSRIAIGVDVYEVWKRDFDRLFGWQDYHVFTGHASIYYRSPWYGLNFNVHAGRYLAGDHGVTFEVTRRFSTGVEIGAFATFTNVPFSKFGEGSFDKGIIIHIPFEWSLPVYSQSSYDLILRSLTRDGGQRLYDDDSLYEETRGTSYDDLTQHLDDVVEP